MGLNGIFLFDPKNIGDWRKEQLEKKLGVEFKKTFTNILRSFLNYHVPYLQKSSLKSDEHIFIEHPPANIDRKKQGDQKIGKKSPKFWI